MILLKNIALDDFDIKKLKAKEVEPINHKLAVITHYLHNIDNGMAKYYKNDAEIFIEELIKMRFPESN